MHEEETVEYPQSSELIDACQKRDRATIRNLIEAVPADSWQVVPGRATCILAPLTVQVWHDSGGSGINTYETVGVSVLPGDELSGEPAWPLFVGKFSCEELRLPNYIPKEARRPRPARELRA